MMGDRHIDFRRLRAMVEDAGYNSDIEVEIFNADIWADDLDEVLTVMKQRYASEVLGD
jgi:sugar phosphate isomerase/epimerase